MERVEAHRQWLTQLQLVLATKGDGSGSDVLAPAAACATRYTQSTKVWSALLTSEDAKDDSQEAAARQLCRDSRPTEDLALTVVVRSAHDPYLVAGELTACEYDFGTPADALRRRTVLHSRLHTYTPIYNYVHLFAFTCVYML